MAVVTCELIWIVNLLNELGQKCLLPVQLFCDNMPAIQISANPVHHERTKHFDLDWHVVRERVSSGFLKTVKIHTNLNVADIFTKGLSIAQHNLFCKKLHLLDMFAS